MNHHLTGTISIRTKTEMNPYLRLCHGSVLVLVTFRAWSKRTCSVMLTILGSLKPLDIINTIVLSRDEHV